MQQLARIPPSLGDLNDAGLEMLAVHHHQSNHFLDRGQHRTQTEQQRTVIAVRHEVSGHVAAVAHDVVAVHVGSGVELAHAGDVPIADLARTAQHHVGHDDRIGDLAGTIAVHRVVPIDEETRVGQTDLLDDVAAEQATFEAQRVHHAIASRAERSRCDRVRNAERDDEIVLPVERTAIIVVAASLNHVVPIGPLGQALDAFRHDGDVVVHDPEPFGTQLVRLLHTCGETARASEVVGLRRVDHAVLVAGQVGHGGAPLRGELGAEFFDHAMGLVTVLVVHDDDAPRGDGKLLDGFEQGGEQLLALVGHHDDSQLFDGLLRNLLFSHTFHSCTGPQPHIGHVRYGAEHGHNPRQIWTEPCTARTCLP